MSRSGYTDDFGCDDSWSLVMWRGAVASSIRGKRGQAFLRELLEALDAMPVKRLIAEKLRQGGEVCALGSIGVKRGVELEQLDPEDYGTLAATFGVASSLIQEIEWVNDDAFWNPTPEDRWQKVREWVVSAIKGTTPSAPNPVDEAHQMTSENGGEA